MAIGPDGGGVIIEVKRQRNSDTDRKLAEVAKRVRSQKGWEFTAIYTNPDPEAATSITKPTSEQVETRLKEIQALLDGGHYAPAFIAGWAVLESLARLASSDIKDGRSGGFSPFQAIQILAGEGYLENDIAQRLREMARLRNAVVHGDLSADVPVEQVEFLLEQLRIIEADISTVMSEQSAV